MSILRPLVAVMWIVMCGSANAQSVSVVQANRANVFGLVQIGPSNGPVTVRQTGSANIAGIIQVGPVNRASIAQRGLFNNAAIAQMSTGRLPGFIP